MKIKELEQEAIKELQIEDKALIKSEIKERLKEIRQTKKVLQRLEAKYTDFLEGTSDDIY